MTLKEIYEKLLEVLSSVGARLEEAGCDFESALPEEWGKLLALYAMNESNPTQESVDEMQEYLTVIIPAFEASEVDQISIAELSGLLQDIVNDSPPAPDESDSGAPSLRR